MMTTNQLENTWYLLFVVVLIKCSAQSITQAQHRGSSPIKVDVTSGSFMNLSCANLRMSTTNNNSQHDIQWLKDGTDVREKNFRFFYQDVSGMTTLKFESIRFDEAGLYECILSNGEFNGTALQRIFKVAVEEKDMEMRFSLDANNTNSSMMKRVGDNVTLDCHVSGAANLARFYQWTYLRTKDSHDNMTMLKSGQEMNVLILKELKRADGGTYSCVVSNVNGFIRKEFILEIKAETEEERKARRKEIIIICLSCVAALSFIVVLSICLSRCFKSHWWKWKTRRARTRAHSYHYQASCSEPPQTPNGDVFKQITPW